MHRYRCEKYIVKVHVILGPASNALCIRLACKKKVWFSGHISEYKLKAHSQCKVTVLVEMRSTTIGLLLHAQLTESTSNTDLHA